jgi:hypothetical protein
MQLGTADVLVRAKTDQYKKDLKTAKDKTVAFGKSAVASIGKISTSMAAFGGVASTAFAFASIKMLDYGSDLQETQGKFDVVFRGMTESAEAWSDTLQDAYAMGETESKKYLSSIQDLLVPTGMLREEAGELSNNFVKMAADLGSFNNRETVEVVRDIQSALQGSSETMAKYGINVKAAKVEQEIFRMGLASSKSEITDAHKAQAIYNIMMREGSDAIGDMARTSDSYANQLKKAKANVTDLKTTIGEGLLPVASDMVSDFNDWFKVNEKVIGQKVPETLGDIGDGLRDIKSIYDAIPDDMVGPGGVGLVGTMLFGVKGGIAVGGLSYLYNEFKDFAEGMEGVRAGFITMDDFIGDEKQFESALAGYRDYKEAVNGVSFAINSQTEGYDLYNKAGAEIVTTNNSISDSFAALTKENMKATTTLAGVKKDSALDDFFDEVENISDKTEKDLNNDKCGVYGEKREGRNIYGFAVNRSGRESGLLQLQNKAA